MFFDTLSSLFGTGIGAGDFFAQQKLPGDFMGPAPLDMSLNGLLTKAGSDFSQGIDNLTQGNALPWNNRPNNLGGLAGLGLNQQQAQQTPNINLPTPASRPPQFTAPQIPQTLNPARVNGGAQATGGNALLQNLGLLRRGF